MIILAISASNSSLFTGSIPAASACTMNFFNWPDSNAFLSVNLRVSEVIGDFLLYFKYLALRTSILWYQKTHVGAQPRIRIEGALTFRAPFERGLYT